MAKTKLKEHDVETAGDLPAVGSQAPDFKLLRQDLSRAGLKEFPGKKVISIFPSIDTPVCATSSRTFNKLAAEKGFRVLTVSEDLPFALKRFCGAEGIEKVEMLSAFRSSFGKDYGVEMTTGPLTGLCARAVLVLDGDNRVVHAELVPAIGQEPNYAAAVEALS